MRSPNNFPPREGGSGDISRAECEWALALVAGHALGALERDEADRLEQHLLLCSECDRELTALRTLTGLIGAAVPQVDPPPAIRARLLATFRTPAGMTPVPAQLAPARTPPRFSQWASSRFASVSLVVAIILLGIWSADTHRSLGDKRDEVSRLQRENEALTVHLSSIQVGQQVLGSSGIWYPLSGVSGSDTAAGGIMLSGESTTATLLSVWNMPDEHKSYDIVCESKRGEMLAAGEVRVNENGDGSVTLNLPAPVSEYRAVHVLPANRDVTDGDSVTKDILQLLLGEPTAIVPAES